MILKTREKYQVTYKRITTRLTAEILQPRSEWDNIFKVLKEKKSPANQKYYTQLNYPSEIMGELFSKTNKN
jgi:hypothetical protein